MKYRNCVIVIPARYASSRFPGKVLANLCGKPMIQHVYERAQNTRANEVLIAADNEIVKTAVEEFGGKCVMTSTRHQSGTDRIQEAVSGGDYEIIINVQGDEPLIPSSVIDELIELMEKNSHVMMATVAVPADRKKLADPNKVKVVLSNNGSALYFSRSMIPFLREGGVDMPTYLHWGIYAYRRSVLEKFVTLPPGKLENCEKLEQLRALENNIPIQVLITNIETIGVDTPDDLVQAEARLRSMQG
ncbi:MAG: 3-deoxy-manno-octulosonate cytidylyltransferase [Lentisphaeria bacterium]|nr:3-deoxy-manno-octulosonate cytidylyltransferase [Lentisphaeria bacterium]